jgi:hypothetical protein
MTDGSRIQQLYRRSEAVMGCHENDDGLYGGGGL